MTPIEHPAGETALAYIGEDSSDVVYRIQADLDAVKDIFSKAQERGNLNADFWMGRQWMEEEVDAHLAQGRHPYVFNEIQHKVDHLVGTQIQTRLDSKCLPREPQDEKAAQLLTSMIKWTEQVNNVEEIESSIFQDTLVKGFGAAVVRWETSDIRHGYVRIEKIPFNELYWDTNSKVDDLSDARWCARVMYMTRMDAIEAMPQYADAIENATITDVSNISTYARLSERQRQSSVHWRTGSHAGREMIQVIEHFERTKKNTYVVSDKLQGTTHRFDAKQAAQDFYDGLVSEYSDAGEILTAIDGSDKVTVETVAKDAIIHTIIVGTESVHRDFTALPSFPYVVNFCYFNDGEYWAFVSNLVDPQRLVNRSFSQYDHELESSTKQLMTVVEQALDPSFTVEDVREERAKTAATIPVRNHQAIQSHPNTPVNPELFNSITFGIARMTDYSGGRNALGFTENAAESGRAVIARAEQGGVARLPLFDRLRSWRRRLSSLSVWYIKNFMPPEQIVRVVGTSGELEFVSLEAGDIDSVRELEYDIQISEASQSDTIRERQFQQFKELLQVAQIPSEISMPILLELSSIPESRKQAIREQLEFYKEYMQRKMQSQHEEKIKGQAQDSLDRQRTRDQLAAQMMQQQEQAEAQASGAGAPSGNPSQVSPTDEEAAIEQLQGVSSPAGRNAMFDKFQGAEIGGRNQASTLSSLGIGKS